MLPLAEREPGALLHDVLAMLADQGITRVLVEGGATLATAFLREGLVDRLYQFEAPLLIGADGLPAIHSLAVRGWTTPGAGGGSRSGCWARTG